MEELLTTTLLYSVDVSRVWERTRLWLHSVELRRRGRSLSFKFRGGQAGSFFGDIGESDSVFAPRDSSGMRCIALEMET